MDILYKKQHPCFIKICFHFLYLFFDICILTFQKGLSPPIPAELVLSFYLNGWKLILAVYHIVVDPKTNMSKFNRYQAECVIPWVNDVLLLLTVALQSTQQLKDKVSLNTNPAFKNSFLDPLCVWVWNDSN